eukprot:1138386-Pelagomonas_calceolata.AAC.6
MNLTGVPPFPTTWVKEDMLGSMLFCGVVQSKCVSKDTIGLTIGFKPASYGGRVRQPAGQVAAPAFTRGAGEAFSLKWILSRTMQACFADEVYWESVWRGQWGGDLLGLRAGTRYAASARTSLPGTDSCLPGTAGLPETLLIRASVYSHSSSRKRPQRSKAGTCDVAKACFAALEVAKGGNGAEPLELYGKPARHEFEKLEKPDVYRHQGSQLDGE